MTRRLALVLSATLVLGVCLVAVSLLRLSGPITPAMVIDEAVEKLALVAAMAAIAWVVQGQNDLRRGQAALSDGLAQAVAQGVAQGESWRAARRAEIAAFGDAVADQFRAWQLSPAEADIAGLLLKGCSLKEVALARDTSEATIRQQAQSVYRKAGLSGRAELSAYFLDSLFSEAPFPGDATRPSPVPLRVVPGP